MFGPVFITMSPRGFNVLCMIYFTAMLVVNYVDSGCHLIRHDFINTCDSNMMHGR